MAGLFLCLLPGRSKGRRNNGISPRSAEAMRKQLPRCEFLQQRHRYRWILGLLALGPVALTGCQGWPINQGARQKAEQQAADQALQRQQLEQKAAAQALVVIKEESRQEGQVAGHQATVHCLRSERAQTDGSELHCEDWTYVQQNYQGASQPAS